MQVVKAMAHTTRMFIVDELSRAGERCVCELTEMIGADIPTVSKHLAILRMRDSSTMTNKATRFSTV